MIRHIVLFHFKSGVTEEEKQSLSKELENLKNNIDRIRTLEVAMDLGCKINSCDMVLNTTFDTMEDVEAYAVHPAHVKALDNIKKMCDSTSKIDYNTK